VLAIVLILLMNAVPSYLGLKATADSAAAQANVRSVACVPYSESTLRVWRPQLWFPSSPRLSGIGPC
jgi:hypothetical protein